jgi:tRNA1Val (adenine37-N6)-methyltransferase
MPTKPPFRFQQFTVDDQRAAMKVGTDGVLLGAWTPIRTATRILDIGTGCGIIALMLAQRTAELNCQISAIEIDHQAAEQAYDNFVASPWPMRLPASIENINFSLEQFSKVNIATEKQFDLVVCNPPFFERSFLSPNPSRSVARHAEDLSRDSLFEHAQRLLTEAGRLAIVLPFEQAESTIETAGNHEFHLWNQTNVRPTPTSELKRVLLEFSRVSSTQQDSVVKTELIIETSRHQYSDEYAELTKEFHLRYSST